MLFNSGVFLFWFLPLILAGTQGVARFGRRAVIGWLGAASLFFYAWWDWRFLGVLLGSIALNFSCSRLIARSENEPYRKAVMTTGIVLNLAILGGFKYLFPLLSFLHLNTAGHEVVLPLGISFFTFTQIAYLVDLEQGSAESHGILEFVLFVTFFPHLIAGPILHHKEMMPQFRERSDWRLRMDDMLIGLTWFVFGLAKKCVLADHMRESADRAFSNSVAVGAPAAWFGIVIYSLQLYFDFSGYSDMAIGLARMFGIRFPLNFDSPYKASSIIDFWKRWHMTLSRYLTVYLFSPISMAVNRRMLRAGKKVAFASRRTWSGFARLVAWPMMATMTIAGIWHGAGLQFVMFGVLHGLYLTVNHAWRVFRPANTSEAKGSVGSVLLTYGCVLLAFVFFRSVNFGGAIAYLQGMAGVHGIGGLSAVATYSDIAWCLLGLSIVWSCPNTQQILGEAQPDGAAAWLRWRPTWQWSVAIGLLFFVAMLSIANSGTFLYFQF